MITTPEALQEVVERARAADVVALDTEFVWERTFYPRLGVVQVGLSSEEVYLIDTVALPDLLPLGALLADASVVKILHDAVQDLTILRRATGAAPLNVFDSQRASGLVGLGASISLQDLVAEATGITLPKGETRTDWCKRPLSEKQIAYAEDDVRHMPALHAWLLDKAQSAGRAGWIVEEMQRYDDPSLFADPDPRAQFERVKARGVGALSDAQRAVLREVTAWREDEARSSDKTRRSVLADDTLVEIARRLPERPPQLSKRMMGERERALYGEAIIEAVERGLAVPVDERPRGPRRRPDEERIAARVQVVHAGIAGRCMREGVDPRIIATKAEIRALLIAGNDRKDHDHSILSGWRRAFIGDDVLALMTGEASVGLGGHGDWPDFVV